MGTKTITIILAIILVSSIFAMKAILNSADKGDSTATVAVLYLIGLLILGADFVAGAGIY